MHPGPVPDDSLVIPRCRAVCRRDGQPVVGSGHHLGFTALHAFQLEACLRLLIVLVDSKSRDLLDVGVVDVLYGLPSTEEGTPSAAQTSGGEDRDGSHEEEEEVGLRRSGPHCSETDRRNGSAVLVLWGGILSVLVSV